MERKAMHRRKLVILNLTCLAIIILALAVKVSRSLPAPHYENEPSNFWQSLFPEPGFYILDYLPEIGQRPSPTPAKPSGPVITAKSYLVGNVVTGKIYLEHNGGLVLPVASMSKLITAVAATDILKPDTEVGITEEEVAVASDTARLAAGERFTVLELLYPLLLNSSNVAAEALASSTDRTKFLDIMSNYAWEVGMPSTYFADPSGLNPRNVSTASDFFNLAKYLYSSKPDILALTRTVKATAATTSEHNAHEFVSIHPFISDTSFLGGKTGHTAAARDTMLSIFKISGQPIAIIVLSSEDRKADTKLLLEKVKSAIAGR